MLILGVTFSMLAGRLWRTVNQGFAEDLQRQKNPIFRRRNDFPTLRVKKMRKCRKEVAIDEEEQMQVMKEIRSSNL